MALKLSQLTAFHEYSKVYHDNDSIASGNKYKNFKGNLKDISI